VFFTSGSVVCESVIPIMEHQNRQLVAAQSKRERRAGERANGLTLGRPDLSYPTLCSAALPYRPPKHTGKKMGI
jgi:hypothetical protein